MACKITYKGIRYNSLEELYADAYKKSKSLESTEQDLRQQQVKPFDVELAKKIQQKLQELYPEIQLNITNNPVWEEGDNIFNQRDNKKKLAQAFKEYLEEKSSTFTEEDFLKSIGSKLEKIEDPLSLNLDLDIIFENYVNAISRRSNYVGDLIGWIESGIPKMYKPFENDYSALIGPMVNKTLLVSHFAPSSLRKGVELINSAANSRIPIVMAVPEYLANQLEKAGFTYITDIPQYFAGEIVMKKVMINNSVREKELKELYEYFQIEQQNIFNQEASGNEINYRLKTTKVVLDNYNKIKQWESNKSINQETLYKKIGELGVPRQQLELLKESEGNTVEEKLTNFVASYSYTVKINTAKNTNYYSNLTVPGGANYTENEIATPAIKPSIKGHAQFATDNGIGWFRSDDEMLVEDTSEIDEPYYTDEEGWVYDNTKKKHISTKTRRILEVQSDLFQKGRDRSTLIFDQSTKFEKSSKEDFEKAKQFGQKENTEESGVIAYNYNENLYIYDLEEGSYSVRKDFERKNDKQNQFLQLLNKDNNWVTFFVKSIIQDSAKKGYEKVLFPSGNTASKVEGHTTLEEFKKQKEDRIKELEKQKATDFYQETEGKFAGMWLGKDKPYKDKRFAEASFDNEINQLKQELERVEREGFGALRPIYNFYENTVANILKKQGYNPVLITDEYGNTWNEVNINQARDLAEVLLQRNEASQIIGQANIKAMTVLIDAINQKQDTLPHEYAHHYIAWFRNTPIVQEAIKKWGSEEALVQSIGEQVVKQKGEAYNWWNSFVKWIMNKFNSLSSLQKEELTQILTDAFLTRQDLSQQQVKPGVEELFESNPELANAVYEAVGLKTLENSRLEKDIKELIKDREDIPSSIFLSYLVDNNLIPKIQEYITSIGYRGGEWNELYGRLTLNYSISNTKSEIAKLMSHELMHALSLKYITSYEALRQPDFKEYIDKVNENEKIKGTNRKIELINLTREQVDAFDNLVRIKEKVFDFIKAGKFNKNEKLTNANFGSLNYAFSELDKKEDIHEFISEAFSNPILIDVLKQIPTEGNKSNLFKEFIKALKIILGFNDESIIEDILYYSEKAFINEALKESNTKKQQAQQLYSQYLDTIFPDSKVKDIVYHGSYTKIDKFLKEFLGKNTRAESAKKGFFFGSSFKNSLTYVENILKQNKKIAFDGVVYINLNKVSKKTRDEFYNILNSDFSDDFNGILTGEELNNLPTEVKKLPIFSFGILENEGNITPYSSEFLSYEDTEWRLNQLSSFQIDFLDSGKSFEEFAKEYVHSVVLNIKNPLVSSDNKSEYREESYSDRIDKAFKNQNDSLVIKNTKDPLDTDIYTVFEPEQIHILGSKQDIEGFNKFVNQPASKPASTKPEQFPSALQEAIDAMIMLDPTRDIQSIIDELTMDGTINQECN